MASWKCGRCGLFNFAETATCRRCGTEGKAAAPPSYHASGYPPQPPQPPQSPQPYNSHYGGQPMYEQQGQWNSGQANAAGTQQQGPVAPLTSPPPQGWAQAPGYAPNPAYDSPPQMDYSQAPSYGAPSAGSYQPSLQMMNNWNQTGVWREGDKLVMHRQAALPDRCIKCNVPTQGSYLHRKLSWINPLWSLLILVSWVIYLVIYYALRKTAHVNLGLCEEHRASRRTGMTVGWLMVGLGVAAFVFAIIGEAFAFLLIGVLLFFGGAIWASYATAVVSVAKMDDQYIWLKRVNQDFLASFPPTSGY